MLGGADWRRGQAGGNRCDDAAVTSRVRQDGTPTTLMEAAFSGGGQSRRQFDIATPTVWHAWLPVLRPINGSAQHSTDVWPTVQ